MFRNILSILLLLITLQLIGQFEPITKMPEAGMDTLHSDIMNEDYYLHVTLPPMYNYQNKDYPVLYYLDAYSSAGAVNDMAIGAMAVKEIEDVIMVGISYKVSPMFFQQKRIRDYIPPIEIDDEKHRGDDFIQFMKTELIPFVDERYRTDSRTRGLVGCSYGGLITAWTLKSEPGLFNRLGIICPSLWYNDASFLSDPDVVRNIELLEDQRIFTSAGSLEHESMISNVSKFEEILLVNQEIEVTKVIFEGESHGSVIFPSIQRAILTLFRNEYKHLVQLANDAYFSGDYDTARDKRILASETYPERVTSALHYNLACVYALTDDRDKSFTQLEKLLKSRYSNYDHISTDKDFIALHGDDRWNDIMDKVKANQEKKKK